MLCTVALRKQAKRCLIGWQPLHSKRSSKELQYLQRAPFWVFFLYTGTELEINKKPPYLPQSNVTVENRVALKR